MIRCGPAITGPASYSVTDASRQPVILGRIVGLFGVRGWVKIHSYTEPREAVLDYRDWLLSRDGDWQPVGLAEGRRHGKGVIARLQGIEDRDAAAELLGSDIGVDRDALPDPGFYAECMEASFDELKQATLGKPPARKKVKRRKKSANSAIEPTSTATRRAKRISRLRTCENSWASTP